MTTKDARDLKNFDALARRLAPLEARKRVTYDSLMAATRVMEKMSAIRDAASPNVRKVLSKKYGWKS